MVNWVKWVFLTLSLVLFGVVSQASAANIMIGTFDTAIDIEALILSVVLVFAPILLLIITIKYGYRLVKTIAAAGAKLFKA
jgi:hypothetical protein